MTVNEPSTGSQGGVAPPPGAMGEQPNVLRQYAAVLRRRWAWVALGVVVGLLAGVASTFLQKEVRDPTSYYRATNTLIYNGSGNGASAPNLQQTAFLVRSADVATGVATDLGINVDVVNDQVAATARNDVQAIDVTAISTDPNQAVTLADTTAKALNDYVANDQQRQFAAQRDEVLQKLDDLKKQRDDLEAQIARNPSGSSIQKAELDSVINQYRLTYEQLQSLANEGGPAGGFSTLQTATAVQINGKAYNTRLEANRNSRGSATPSVTQPTAQNAASETDLSVSSGPSKTTRIAIGGLTGLVLGLVAAFVVEAWDDRLRRRERVESVTGLPVIAEVPTLPKDQRSTTIVPAVDLPRSRVAERYRSVRTALLFVLRQHQMTGAAPTVSTSDAGEPDRTPVVMITSPNPGEGKTTTVANVAATFGDSGMRTLVIDCDYRKPSIGRYLAAVPDLDNPDDPAPTRLENVWFVPAPTGDQSPAEIITELRRTVERWRPEFDIIFLDTPPMLTTNDATDLLAAADRVVVVLRAGQTRTGPAQRVTGLLWRYRADVLGIVLNSCSASELEPHYGSYYGEDASKKRGKDKNRPKVDGNGSRPSKGEKRAKADDGSTTGETPAVKAGRSAGETD